jgi:WD40 repeat protein
LLLTRTAEERATRRLFDARLAQARAGSLSRRVGQRFDSLAAVGEATRLARDLKLPPESFLDLRNAAIACLALPDLRLVKPWPGWPASNHNVDFDDKLEIYARADPQGVVTIGRVSDGQQTARLPATGSGVWILMSRDGKYLAVWSATQMKVWNLDRPDPVAVLNLSGDGFYPDFSPDGRLFVNAHRDGPVRLYDLATGQIQRVFPGGPSTSNVAFRPKFRQISVGRGAVIEILDLDTGKVVVALPHQPYTPASHVWHPDGTTLAVLCNDLRVHLWDVAAAKQTLVLDRLSNFGTEIAFNHAGDLLVTSGWDGKLRLWDPRTGQHLLSTTPGGGSLRFSPDDRHLTVNNLLAGKLGRWEIAAGPEYRTMATTSAGITVPFFSPSVHRDGRLLAAGLHGGVGLWDLVGGRELFFIPLPGATNALFEPTGSLLTNGPAGLLRWAVRPDPATPGGVRLGPPEKLAVPGSIYDLACSADGRVTASAQSRGGSVLHTARPNQPIPLAPHDDTRYVAVSPDGKRVATGSHWPAGVTIWDADNGTRSKVLPGVGWGVKFSPDGKWLGTVSGGYRLWEVGSWREGPNIGGGEGADFSPDGKLLAVETGSGAIRLVNPDSGREYARLEDPNQDRAGRITFSPDGTQLVATSGDSQSIHVWDLRLIRARLVEMGLDWDVPSYPPAKPAAGPLRVEVDLGKPAAGKKGPA